MSRDHSDTTDTTAHRRSSDEPDAAARPDGISPSMTDWLTAAPNVLERLTATVPGVIYVYDLEQQRNRVYSDLQV